MSPGKPTFIPIPDEVGRLYDRFSFSQPACRRVTTCMSVTGMTLTVMFLSAKQPTG